MSVYFRLVRFTHTYAHAVTLKRKINLLEPAVLFYFARAPEARISKAGIDFVFALGTIITRSTCAGEIFE